jgi:RimJ/RimL family protein N-acetyltransferase
VPDAVTLQTPRLVMRRPSSRDADSIFERYASDPVVTRYMSWPRHTSIDDTRAFIAFSDAEWKRWECGPLLVFSRGDGALLGGAGLVFEAVDRAVAGYVFARDAWGRGYATETLLATVDLARARGVRELRASCHTAHAASWRVLEKCGFVRQDVLRRQASFPNLGAERPITGV